jgi:hypothetical protein
LLLLSIASCGGNFHRAYNNMDRGELTRGRGEPGLWRPRFIIDRTFFADGGQPEKRDRLYLRYQHHSKHM